MEDKDDKDTEVTEDTEQEQELPVIEIDMQSILESDLFIDGVKEILPLLGSYVALQNAGLSETAIVSILICKMELASDLAMNTANNAAGLQVSKNNWVREKREAM